LHDHAALVEDLNAIWGNVVAYPKPGGKFLGVRVQSIGAEYIAYGKYRCSTRRIWTYEISIFHASHTCHDPGHDIRP
jgi:hypothetical protein